MPDPAAPLADPQDAAQCRECHRPLKDPQSLLRRYGRDCAEKLGLVGPKRVRLARVRYWAEIDGQADLLNEDEEHGHA